MYLAAAVAAQKAKEAADEQYMIHCMMDLLGWLETRLAQIILSWSIQDLS